MGGRFVKVEVLLACNPRFAESAKLRFDRPAPGETRRIWPVDLRPDHAYLTVHQESARALSHTFQSAA